jgi:hypothetical protein
MTPEEKQEPKAIMKDVRIGQYAWPELRAACLEAIDAIDNNDLTPAIARKLRKALDKCNSPVGQYGKFGQPVTTEQDHEDLCKEMGWPILKFKSS